MALKRDLAPFILELDELDDGFRLRFPGDACAARKVVEFVQFERRCCSFLRYEVVFEPNEGPLWLTLHGDENAKRAMKELLVEWVPEKLRGKGGEAQP